ncbi:recombinase family protein [Terrabacter terrigena]
MPTRRCAIYARISVSSEESVSIDRQIESAEQYAAARGWTVAGVFKDDGVSATHNKPEDRAGWRALLASRENFDAVIIWKIDRLARRVIDFLHADVALQERNAGIVAVEQSIDMTSAEGRMIAQVLAIFAEYEAAAISARVAAARTHLLRSGRVVGGTVPYGYRSVPNPTGPGFVLAHDPERIEYVRTMVKRTREGRSIYSTVQWLDEMEAPTPTGRGSWVYSTVERILRHPILAGMTAFNPGNADKVRGQQVLPGENGLPVVDESLAIMTQAEWRAMVRQLDERDTAQSKPVALRAKTSGLLSGLVMCGDDRHGSPVRMWRGTIQGRPGYYCPECSQAISNFEHVVVQEFLRQKGERVRWSVVEEVLEGGAALIPEIEHRLDELDTLLRQTRDREERARLQDEQARLLDLRDEKEAEAPVIRHVATRGTQMFGEDWEQAETDEERRDILGDALHSITVRRGRPGRRTDAQILARLTFDWKVPEDLGPIVAPTDEELASWAEEA